MLSAQEWILLALLGGIFGMLGQVARIAVGLKKLHEETTGDAEKFKASLQTNRLLVSLMFGFAAGVLSGVAVVATQDTTDQTKMINLNDVSAKFLFGLIAAGYAGTDFFEGFMKSYIKPSTS